MSADTGLNLAVVGKGGVGKTTIAAGLSLALARGGQSVFAVDGDSNNCLGYVLGFPADELAALRPLSEMREELEELAKPGGGGMYLLTPPVADLIDKYSLSQDNLRLLVMGAVGEGGGGCACGINSTLRQVLRDLVKRPEAIVVDMEAGIEHLGRGTAMHLDTMLMVAEATESSLRTCRRIVGLAADIGIERLVVVANRIRRDEDLEVVRRGVGDLPVIASLPYMEDFPESLAESSVGGERLLSVLAGALEGLG